MGEFEELFDVGSASIRYGSLSVRGAGVSVKYEAPGRSLKLSGSYGL